MRPVKGPSRVQLRRRPDARDKQSEARGKWQPRHLFVVEAHQTWVRGESEDLFEVWGSVRETLTTTCLRVPLNDRHFDASSGLCLPPSRFISLKNTEGVFHRYSPGLITSSVLYLPISLVIGTATLQSEALSVKAFLGALAVGLSLLVFVIWYGLFHFAV